MTLEETLQKIHPLDEKAMEISRKRWDSIAKPLHSLGKRKWILEKRLLLPCVQTMAW